jgi:hypothetical protein
MKKLLVLIMSAVSALTLFDCVCIPVLCRV